MIKDKSSKNYLEIELPKYLENSLENFKIGQKKLNSGEKYLLFDCDYCELQSNINCAEVDNDISSEQAWYLRAKYLGLKKDFKMENGIDFTDLETKRKGYTGANGGKKCVIYENESFMVKFPPEPSINKDMSYTNSCISEYLGCHIFNMLGIQAQETYLGTYRIENKCKIIVACKDFETPGLKLMDFSSLKNQVVDSGSNGSGTELSDITDSIEKQKSFDAEFLTEHFWNMFVVDAFIGNWDRHNGNWGFLYNDMENTLKLAPVFDCGSSLYPQADEEIIKNTLSDKNQMEIRIKERPHSAIRIDGKNIKYWEFINNCQNPDCNRAVKRIFPRIKFSKIINLIDNTPYINDLQKEFYNTMLLKRYEMILSPAFQKIAKQKELKHSSRIHDEGWER